MVGLLAACRGLLGPVLTAHADGVCSTGYAVSDKDAVHFRMAASALEHLLRLVLESSAILPHEPPHAAQADAVLLGDLLADAARLIVCDHGGDRLG